jgi:VWFA-related protein
VRILGRTVLGGLLLAVWAAAAPPARHVALQRIDVSLLPEIHVYFTVTDERGGSVIGLTEREITVSCDGAAQPVTSLRSAIEGGEAMAAVLLFDRSGSLKAAIDQSRVAAVGFIRRLAENDQVAVISFDETITVNLPLTTDKAAAEAAVRAIVPGSNTVLFDAVGAGLAETRKAGTKRLALIVLSDGKDTRSRATPAEAVAKAKGDGVAVFTIGFGVDAAAGVLRELAESTGGRYSAASGPKDLLAIYQTIGESLANQYHLIFRPAFGQDEAWHKMEIRVAPPEGVREIAAASREFIASKGPGVSRTTLGGFERREAGRRYLLWAILGAVFGTLFGLLLVVVLKLLRADVRLRAVAVIGMIVLGALLGGLVGVILVSVS